MVTFRLTNLPSLVDTYKWRKLPHNGLPQDIPYQRYGHTAVAYNQCCYIFGGRNDVDGVSEYLYEFNVGRLILFFLLRHLPILFNGSRS